LTVNLAPVPETGLRGIFTYTVTFPNDVSAVLTLTGVGGPIAAPLTSGTKVSMEVDPGYYTIDTNVSPGNTYYYMVHEVNLKGEEPLSGPVSGTPPAPGAATLLNAGAWTAGEITSPGEAHWYRFTAAPAGIHIVQWKSFFEGTGAETLGTLVSAYREDGTPLLQFNRGGYNDPPYFNVNSGETVCAGGRP
jgi:hypothetical protein